MRKPLPRIVLLLAMVLLAYLPVVRCGFIWDDDFYVTNNITLRSSDGLGQIWFEPGATPQYYPLVFTTFWLEFHLWGLQATGYHLTNVVLHGLNSILFYLLLTRLKVPGAWFAAAIFGLHPVEVESVAWITERKNVLSGFFYLLSFLAFLRFSPPERDLPRGKLGWLFVAQALFVAALLSKTVTCSLPAVLVLVYWWKRDGWRVLTRREVLGLLVMFAVGLLLALNTVRLEKKLVGAEGPDWDFSPVERILIAGRALWFYLGKLLWPHPLIFNYERWQIDQEQGWQYLFPAAAALVLVALWVLRGRLGRGPVTACAIFAGTLVPALGFFNVYPMIFSFVADHFQYLASAAFIALVVAAVHHIGRNWDDSIRGFGRFFAAGILMTLGGLTWMQCGIYQNVATLWHDTLTKNPDSWLAHQNLGAHAMDRGDYALAEAHFRRVLQIFPRHVDTYYNWGVLYAKQDRFDEAEKKWQEAITVATEENQWLFQGLIHLARRQQVEALSYFHRVLEKYPRNPFVKSYIQQALDSLKK